MTKYTIGIYFSEDRKQVALILKNRPEWQKGKYNFPGGHVEQNELPVDCIKREFKEECGITIFNHDWFYIGKIVNGEKYEVSIFTATQKGYNGKIKTVEDQAVEWIDIDKLPDNVISNLRWLVPFALNCHEHNGNDILQYGIFEYNG